MSGPDAELARVFLEDGARREDAAIRRHAELLKELAQTKEVFARVLASLSRVESKVKALERWQQETKEAKEHAA